MPTELGIFLPKQSGTAFDILKRLCTLLDKRGAETLFFQKGIKYMDSVKHIKKIKRHASVALPTFEHLKNDIATIKERDPAAKSTAEIVLLYSGLHAMFAYRVAHKLYKSEHYLSARRRQSP